MANIDLRMVQQTLELQLEEAATGSRFGDAIRIHQVADPVDMTQEAAERDLAVEMLDRGSALVRRLRAAIARIQDGSYGICLQCEEEIAPKRLKAIPSAELCIGCQEMTDHSSRRGSPANSEGWKEAA